MVRVCYAMLRGKTMRALNNDRPAQALPPCLFERRLRYPARSASL